MSHIEKIASLINLRRLCRLPLQALRDYDVKIMSVPPGNDTQRAIMWCAVGGGAIAIAHNQVNANAGANTVDAATQSDRPMLCTPMRDNNAVGNRTLATALVMAGNADLWVTTTQTGCSVLVLDWGLPGYSMVHLQPSLAMQFNRTGRGIMNTGDSPRRAYQNFWLKQELTAVATNTGGLPERYILIQSQFDARSQSVQILGVRNGNGFDFYRQRRARGYGGGNGRTVEQLRWTPWNRWLPYWSS